MKSYEFEAVIYNGNIYCCECLPPKVDINDDDVMPIFGDSEWEYIPTCCICGEQHIYVTLLDETWNGECEDEKNS